MNKIIVVEGKNDEERVKKFIDVFTVSTGGQRIAKETISLLKQLAKTNQLVIFTDPDHAGKKIREFLNKEIPNCLNAFVKERKDGKKGIENADKEDILNALTNLVDINKKEQSITWEEYTSLKLVGDKDSANYRLALCEKLNIPYYNGKRLFEILNQMGIKKSGV